MFPSAKTETSVSRCGQMQARDVDLEVAWKLQAKKLPGRIETSIICLKICEKYSDVP